MNARQILDAAGIAYRLRQDEYWALCPFHQEKTPSFSVSDKKQSFYCFGCGAKGSLKSLAKKLNVQVNNFSQKTGVERAEKPAPKIIMPVPPDAPDVERCGLIPNQGRIFAYRNENGEPLFFVVRAPQKDGGKTFFPLSYSREGWVKKAPPPPRPLYRLQSLKAGADLPVMIVEGEKTAEAAAKLFAGKYVVLSWYGGAAGVDGADFSPLKNRTVVVCPDNDGPGKKAAAKIAEKLAKFGVEAKIFSPPENLPEKWDWADFTEGPNQAIELLDKGLGQETDDNPFGKAMRVVGKRLNQNGAFEYIVQIPGYGVCFIEADKIKPSWLLSVHSQKEFWLAVAKWKYFKVESRGLIGEILCLMEQEAAKRPPFGATQIRGRGVWNDEGKTVLHLGETIMVDDKKVETGYCSPEAIYIQRPALKFVKNKEFDLAKVVQTFREVAWRNSVLAETIVGWAVAAPICGLLTWRPHIWITGPAGCGKSFVLQTLQNILHPFCFAFQSDQTTEAGIRQTVAEDAMPILFDEADPRPEKQKQFQSILALARSASSDESPNIVKGTPLHKQIHFQCRSMFAFASIVSQVVQAADKSRFCELEIVGPQNTPLKPQKLEKGGMLRFSYQRRKQILEAIQISKETFFELGLDARHADQLGTLAGAWCAATGQNPKHLDKWKFFVAEHLQEQSNAHEEAFEALLACKIEHKNETIGDVIRYIVQTNQNSPSVSIDDESKNKLSVFGVWINLRQNKIFVQPTNPYLAAYFSKHTPFGQNFGKVLGRYPGAQKHFVGRPWGIGKAIRCIAIPFELQSLVRTETQNQAPPPQF